MTQATSHHPRLFFALWPSETTRAALARLQFDLHGKKTPYRNFHITLAFLGHQPSETLPTLKAVLSGLVGQEMDLTIDRRSYFPRSRVAWAGLRDAPTELYQLQAELTQQLLLHKVAFESGALFKPHLTLARESDKPPELSIEPIHWRASQVALVQSVQVEEGMRYDVLASHWLSRLPGH